PSVAIFGRKRFSLPLVGFDHVNFTGVADYCRLCGIEPNELPDCSTPRQIVSNNERGTLQAGFGFVNSALGNLQGFTKSSFRFGGHMPRPAPVKAAGERDLQGTASRVASGATSTRRICHISYGI